MCGKLVLPVAAKATLVDTACGVDPIIAGNDVDLSAADCDGQALQPFIAGGDIDFAI